MFSANSCQLLSSVCDDDSYMKCVCAAFICTLVIWKVWRSVFCFFSPPQGEGVAYRGRLLLELSTKLDQKPEQRSEDISPDHLLVVEVSSREHLHHLLHQQLHPFFPLTFTLPYAAEVPEEEEVLALRGVLLGHAAAGRGPRRPFWGQHRKLRQQVWLLLSASGLHHPVQSSRVRR